MRRTAGQGQGGTRCQEGSAILLLTRVYSVRQIQQRRRFERPRSVETTKPLWQITPHHRCGHWVQPTTVGRVSRFCRFGGKYSAIYRFSAHRPESSHRDDFGVVFDGGRTFSDSAGVEGSLTFADPRAGRSAGGRGSHSGGPMAIDTRLIDKLLADYKKPEDIIGENGLLKQLTKALLERAMQDWHRSPAAGQRLTRHSDT